ncbi:hypothetical protein T190115A13A_40113 [Tenacibaculum sp. 190524A02b]|uniref:Uncharacterized protein n=1 Tax=Tenacibaculum vairaonense TaxID=3137860 RepID=A0ABM9PPB9_9FLAO
MFVWLEPKIKIFVIYSNGEYTSKSDQRTLLKANILLINYYIKRYILNKKLPYISL